MRSAHVSPEGAGDFRARLLDATGRKATDNQSGPVPLFVSMRPCDCKRVFKNRIVHTFWTPVVGGLQIDKRLPDPVGNARDSLTIKCRKFPLRKSQGASRLGHLSLVPTVSQMFSEPPQQGVANRFTQFALSSRILKKDLLKLSNRNGVSNISAIVAHNPKQLPKRDHRICRDENQRVGKSQVSHPLNNAAFPVGVPDLRHAWYLNGRQCGLRIPWCPTAVLLNLASGGNILWFER